MLSFIDLKTLVDLGLTPVNAILVGVIVVLWKLNKERDARQSAERERWHLETRGELDKLRAHTDKCEEDREELRIDQAILRGQIKQMSHCPKPDCPMRANKIIEP